MQVVEFYAITEEGEPEGEFLSGIVYPDATEREKCREAGLSDEQAEQVFKVCGATGISVDQALAALAPHMRRVADELNRVMGSRFDEPPLGVLRELHLSRSERRAEEQRLRSMRKPTGKPWDRRGR